MAELHHKQCGQKVATYHGDLIAGQIIEASKFERIDGTHPCSGDAIVEICPACKKSYSIASDTYIDIPIVCHMQFPEPEHNWETKDGIH